MTYKVQSPKSATFTFFNTARAAHEEAQEIANIDGCDCDVWERIETIKPEPKTEPEPPKPEPD